jgi:hypothetical protein
VRTVAVAPWQPSGWTTKSTLLCGARTTVAGTNGNAAIRVCLVYYRNQAGTYYYQGVIEVTYKQARAGGSDSFSGTAMAVLDSTKKATTLVDCPSVVWGDGGDLWCFSKTVTIHSPAQKLYAKGNAAGKQYPVASPVFTMT